MKGRARVGILLLRLIKERLTKMNPIINPKSVAYVTNVIPVVRTVTIAIPEPIKMDTQGVQKLGWSLWQKAGKNPSRAIA